MPNRIQIVVLLVGVVLVVGLSTRHALAAPAVVPFTVNSVRDVVDDNPGDGACHTSVSSAVAVQPSGFVFVACPFCNLLAGDFTTTSSAGDTALTVAAAILDPTFLTFQSQQAVRGGLAVNVPVTSATTSVGTIVGSPAVFTSGDSFNLGTAFHPLAAGMSVLTVGTPAGFSMPSNGRQITAAV